MLYYALTLYRVRLTYSHTRKRAYHHATSNYRRAPSDSTLTVQCHNLTGIWLLVKFFDGPISHYLSFWDFGEYLASKIMDF